MSSRLLEIFEDKIIIDKIKNRLPYLFQLAEIECSRAGKIGMQVGSLRENIIVALLIYKFGETSVKSDIPITEPEVDLELFGKPISIKTITGKSLGGVKLSWTVDAPMAKEFMDTYQPKCDVLFLQIVWDSKGAFYYIPVEVQERVLKEVGREQYMKLPKPGTNPRGVEISKEALTHLINDKDTSGIEIIWKKSQIDYLPYKRWIDYWKTG